MTEDRFDETEPADPDEQTPVRVEDAFRAALAAHADDVAFRPVDPETLRLLAQARAEVPDRAEVRGAGEGRSGAGAELAPPRRRQGGWRYALAAAVVLVLAIPLVGIIVQRNGGGSLSAGAGSVPQAAPAGVPETDLTRNSGSTAPGSASGEPVPSLPEPAPGFRWAQLAGVALQVPQSWGTAVAPGPNWCRQGSVTLPTAPYVASGPVDETGGCADLAAEQQVEHVEWRPARGGEVAGTRTANGWSYSSRIVAGTLITYVFQPGADQGILWTARPR